ncbi:MAG: exopolysaccharide biosynthesis protein [Pseudomonadota bacterium]|nr:exopolysaccharide biosynthesis protein [Pseudomonadota bacterium]
MISNREPQSLNDILTALRKAAEGDHVSVRDILAQIGSHSFAPLLLVPALILISPISGIPGTPTIGSIIILLIAGQAVLGRDQLWLPGFIMRRKISAARFCKALDFMQRPVDFVDRHSHKRLAVLTYRPLSFIAMGICVSIAAIMPFLELLPMVTSLGATAIALFAVGLMVSDGLFVVTGYAVLGGAALLVSHLISLA